MKSIPEKKRSDKGRPAKPIALAVKPSGIPRELTDLDQWVVWQYTWKNDDWTKPPYDAKTDGLASTTNGTTWCDYQTALAAYRKGEWDGIGFVPTPEAGIVGIDLDHCRDKDTGKVEKWAQEYIDRLDTYTELSPSREGFRLFLVGTKPGARCKKGDIEIYNGLTAEGKQGGRFLTITGHHVDGTPTTINRRPEAIASFYSSVFSTNGDGKAATTARKIGTPSKNGKATGNSGLTDHDVLSRMLSSKHCDKASKLWRGDTAGYVSHSEADAALCSYLAFWTGKDTEQIDRLFRRSGLMRPKWDRGDYRGKTIGLAIAGCTETYKAPEKATPATTATPFPVDTLPEPFQSYVVAASKAVGCDASMVALPLLAAIAGAIGNTRRVELKAGWQEAVNLWCVIIGYSGDLKSPALDAALAPVRARQTAAVKTWQAETEASVGTGKPPTCKRYIVGDTTIEALASLLAENPRGLLLARDELSGWLGGFDQYKAKGRGGDVPHWLELHRGGQLLVDRKTGPQKTIHVERASVSVAGGIQPEPARQALSRGHFDDGLAARLLLAWPARKPRKWTNRAIDPEQADAVAKAFDALYRLDFDAANSPRVLSLSAQAKEAFVEFFDRHGQEQIDLDGPLAAAWAKLEAYAARLSLVLELATWAATGEPELGPGVVRGDAMRKAITLTEWFGNEARRAYAAFSETEAEKDQRELLAWLQRRGGTATAREVQQGVWRFHGDGDGAEKALSELVKAGMGEWHEVKKATGRPTHRFTLTASTKPEKTQEKTS